MRYAVTIFISSFFIFQIQPVIARFILPWYGGSAAVWTARVDSPNGLSALTPSLPVLWVPSVLHQPFIIIELGEVRIARIW